MSHRDARHAMSAVLAGLAVLLMHAMPATAQDRMPPIPEDKMTAEQKAAVEEFKRVRQRPNISGPFVPLLRSPEMLSRARNVGDHARYNTVLPPRLSEMVILITARHWTQNYEWAAHASIAESEGLDPAIIAAIADGRRPRVDGRRRGGALRLLHRAVPQPGGQRPDLRPHGRGVRGDRRHRHHRHHGLLLAAGDGDEHRAHAAPGGASSRGSRRSRNSREGGLPCVADSPRAPWFRWRPPRCWLPAPPGGPPTAAGRAAAPASCAALTALELPDTTITAAERVPAGSFTPAAGAAPVEVPAFCRAVGRTTPAIHFEVWLPQESWNGKFQGIGNGGMAGSLYYDRLAAALARGYAAAATDTGHVSANTFDATWAFGRPDLVADFGHRALHLTTVNAKAITEAYYGAPPAYSYYVGCSKGGQQGLMEAQRYPDDYDGLDRRQPRPRLDALLRRRAPLVRAGHARGFPRATFRPRSCRCWPARSTPRATRSTASRTACSTTRAGAASTPPS